MLYRQRCMCSDTCPCDVASHHTLTYSVTLAHVKRTSLFHHYCSLISVYCGLIYEANVTNKRQQGQRFLTNLSSRRRFILLLLYETNRAFKQSFLCGINSFGLLCLYSWISICFLSLCVICLCFILHALLFGCNIAKCVF